MNTDQPAPSEAIPSLIDIEEEAAERKEAAIRDQLQIHWDIREVFETVLRVHDSLIGRRGQPIPLSPREVADILELKRFSDASVKYAFRRCFCNTVYCRSPVKDKPCVLDPEEMVKNKDLIYACKWRGKKL